MYFKQGASNLQLSTKLLLLNLVTSGAFILITGIIIISFASVRNKSIDVTNKDIESVTTNSQTTRLLSEVFADIDLLNRTFYKNDNYLISEVSKLK